MTNLMDKLKEKSTGVSVDMPTGELRESKPMSLELQLQTQMKKMESEISKALPGHISVERFSRIILTEVKSKPKLLKVLQDAPVTLWSAILLSAQLGLDLTPTLGQAYIIPYNNGNTGKTEAQLQIGYRGLLTLIRNSGEISSITCEVVYEKDFIDIQFGTEQRFIHKPFLDGDAGEAKLYYLVAKFKNGDSHIEFMTKSQIDKIRKRSKSSNSGPWVTDYDEMAKKTVIRRASKRLPLSTDILMKLGQDEVIKRAIDTDMLQFQAGESNDEIIDLKNDVEQ